MTDDRERLLDILGEIERIRRHLPVHREDFDGDEVLQAALTRWLQVIGEAASKLAPDLRAAHPEVPWRDIIGMRHRVVHDYSYVDLNTVWRACTTDVPRLESQVRAILGGLG